MSFLEKFFAPTEKPQGGVPQDDFTGVMDRVPEPTGILDNSSVGTTGGLEMSEGEGEGFGEESQETIEQETEPSVQSAIETHQALKKAREAAREKRRSYIGDEYWDETDEAEPLYTEIARLDDELERQLRGLSDQQVHQYNENKD